MYKVTMEPVVNGSDFFGFEIKVDGIVIDKADDFAEAKRLKEKYIGVFLAVGKRHIKTDRNIFLVTVILAIVLLIIKYLT